MTVYAGDEAGNVGVSEVAFTVESFPSFIAIAVVSAAVVAGLLFYFKKHRSQTHSNEKHTQTASSNSVSALDSAGHD